VYSAYGCGFNWGGLPSAAINLVWLNLNRSRAAAAATRLASSATIAHVCSNAAIMLDIWCRGRMTIKKREMRGWSIGGDDVVQHILLRQPSLGARAGLVTICGHDRDTFIYASLIYLTPPSTLKLLLPHPFNISLYLHPVVVGQGENNAHFIRQDKPWINSFLSRPGSFINHYVLAGLP
jgi:hypothetical protein